MIGMIRFILAKNGYTSNFFPPICPPIDLLFCPTLSPTILPSYSGVEIGGQNRRAK